MPFWALIASSSINALADRCSLKIHARTGIIKAMLVALVLFTMVYGTAQWFFLSPEEFKIWKYKGANPFGESPVVAGRVSSLTSPDDYVLVAGSEPQILYYARRKSPTRFAIFYPLMMNTPLARAYQAEAISDIARSIPKVIVFATSPTSWLKQPGKDEPIVAFLNHLLHSRYYLAGGFVRGGERGYWEEPLALNRTGSCSLLVYRKKTE